MRKTVLAMVLAGAMVPGIAMAQTGPSTPASVVTNNSSSLGDNAGMTVPILLLLLALLIPAGPGIS